MRSIGIKSKIIFLTGFLISGLLFLGVLGIWSESEISKDLNHVTINSLPTVRNIALMDMVHDGIRGVALEAMLGVSLNNQEYIESAEKGLTEFENSIHEHLKSISELKQSEQFMKLLKTAENDFNEYVNSAKSLVATAKKKDAKDTQTEFTKFQAQFESLEKSLESFGDFSEGENKESLKYYKNHSDKIQTWTIITLITLSIFGFLISYFIAKSLISSLTSTSEQISQGANDSGTAIIELTTASQDLSSSSAEQAAALQETAAALEEITSMVKKSADNAQKSEENSNRSKDKAIHGKEVVEQMVSSIEEINQNNDIVANEIQESNNRISEIVKVIHEIGNKTKVINDIVFQTKLLSFNASVEAARSGEHGKGFAVVAEEVGDLAGSCGNASKEISVLLDESIRKVTTIVQESKDRIGRLMETTKATVQRGSQVAHECGTVLSEIVDESSKVSDMVVEISTATQEQARGIDEISKAIQQLDQATQTNANAAANCASTAEKLSGQANELRTASLSLQQVLNGKVSVTKFVWKDEYALGVNSMDNEHKVLIEKINNLAMALESSPNGKSPKVKNAFSDMANYTTTHFSHEEKYMNSISYPELSKHKDIHKKLLEQVSDFGKQVDQGRVNGNDLMNFLNDWLLKHILGIDMKYARFSRQDDNYDSVA